MIVASGAVVTQLDTPMPGPADIVGGVAIVAGLIYMGYEAVVVAPEIADKLDDVCATLEKVVKQTLSEPVPDLKPEKPKQPKSTPKVDPVIPDGAPHGPPKGGDGKRVYYHYTTSAAAASIKATGLRPGPSGFVYLTPTLYTSKSQVMKELALDPTVGGRDVYFIAALPRDWPLIGPETVPESLEFEQPGGGIQYKSAKPIPPSMLEGPFPIGGE